MNKCIIIILTFVCAITTKAQETDTGIALPDTATKFSTEPAQVIIGSSDEATDMYVYDGLAKSEAGVSDSLNLPLFNRFGQSYINMYPYDWFGTYDWQLHKGLNISLGASVFASFGNDAWSGTGFTQSISAMYAIPITGRLSLAVGGYLNNLYWSRDAFHDAGLNAVLGYKFDEHWEGYIFGQKSLMNKMIPLPLYDISRTGDRIGAAVKYNFNPKFSIQVMVSAER